MSPYIFPNFFVTSFPFLYIEPRHVQHFQFTHCGPHFGSGFSQSTKLRFKTLSSSVTVKALNAQSFLGEWLSILQSDIFKRTTLLLNWSHILKWNLKPACVQQRLDKDKTICHTYQPAKSTAEMKWDSRTRAGRGPWLQIRMQRHPSQRWLGPWLPRTLSWPCLWAMCRESVLRLRPKLGQRV